MQASGATFSDRERALLPMTRNIAQRVNRLQKDFAAAPLYKD
jgi:hypothetical protein